MSDTEDRRIMTRKEALAFLKTKGTKVAIQVGVEGDYVFAEKTDFIDIILKGRRAQEHETFVNYDGEPTPVIINGSVLNIPCDTF
jgi:hypothetical protein